MALLTRMARLFRADFHAVLDRLEEPDVLLRQSLREMEEELQTDQQSEKRRQLDLENLQRKRDELEKTLSGIAEELDICFAAQREELARNLVKRRLETERRLEHLLQQSGVLEKSLDNLRSRLRDQQERLEMLQQKAALLDENPRNPSPSTDTRPFDTVVGEDEIEIAFLREKQRRIPS
jgi:phage shock protein A